MEQQDPRREPTGQQGFGPVRLDSIEIGENMAFTRREWTAQAVGSVVLVLVVLAALLGVFGTGPLSDTTAESEGLRVDYPRFVRYRAPAVITLHIGPEATRGNVVEVWLSREFIQEMRVEELSPQPSSVSVAPDEVRYSFELSSDAPSGTIVLWVQPERIGRLRGSLGVEGGPQVTLTQFVYP